MARTIDLNCDLGEIDTPEAIARDCEIMAHISSANIACGGHAGNATTMAMMLEAASAAGVAMGAHPSYPDRENFGRVSMAIDHDALAASLISQISALRALADVRGLTLSHVKVHGALYNDAADNRPLADLIAEVVIAALPHAAYVGLAGSEMAGAAARAGLVFVAEGFADRRYDDRGRLVPRGAVGAVLASADERIGQALALAGEQPVSSQSGAHVLVRADSICLHSDSNGALASARDIRAALAQAGIEISAPK